MHRSQRVLPFHSILLLCAASLVGFVRSLSQHHPLSQTYLDIAQRANQLEAWPDAKKFREDCLVYQSDTNTYQLPHFTDGHGPIGVFGFLDGNPTARTILKQCDEIFETFCHDEFKMDPDWILQAPPTSHHITVAILQEHPTFLRNSKDLDKWRPISNSTIERLSGSFAKTHMEQEDQECPQLKLDSLLWTPDGAMIAGFVDESPSKSFDRIRNTYREIAQQELGDLLTTRPKNLIHTTIGRVIGLPPGASPQQHAALRELSLHYNENILPALVQTICWTTHGGGQFALEELSLARNTIWMLQEYIEYSRWSLGGTR